MKYIHRELEATVANYLKLFPVVGITGPRQSGKSTMLKAMLSSQYEYVSFDDFELVNFFHDDPVRFMKRYPDKIIFDEVQRVPEIFHSIKLAVDSDRHTKGKFVLTGSSQFSFLKKVSESLAGRIGLLSLLPFQYSEIPKRLHEESIYQGGYPELVMREYESSIAWFASYLDTYLTRDVRDVRDIGDIRDFRRCVQMLAARVSQILNLSELSRDIGVSVPTIKKWISVLEASYIVFLLPPYYKNLGKRIIKSPKIFFFDTGLVSYLTGIRTQELFERGPMFGSLFENYVISEIYKRELHARKESELFYYRTSNGVEVDVIIDRKSYREFVEIKASETFRPDMTKSIKQIKKDKERGYLIYQGKSLDTVSDIKILQYGNYLR
ncbi:MAG: ATP-binding protein [Ignavibacteriae bacterium]|nr:ATP-binding protein [Ignavibacteriota bacterium]